MEGRNRAGKGEEMGVAGKSGRFGKFGGEFAPHHLRHTSRLRRLISCATHNYTQDKARHMY